MNFGSSDFSEKLQIFSGDLFHNNMQARNLLLIALLIQFCEENWSKFIFSKDYTLDSKAILLWQSVLCWLTGKRLRVVSFLVCNLIRFPLFGQWYLTLLSRSRNETITAIKAGSLSWHHFTRLLSARSLCPSPLARVT